MLVGFTRFIMPLMDFWRTAQLSFWAERELVEGASSEGSWPSLALAASSARALFFQGGTYSPAVVAIVRVGGGGVGGR